MSLFPSHFFNRNKRGRLLIEPRSYMEPTIPKSVSAGGTLPLTIARDSWITDASLAEGISHAKRTHVQRSYHYSI